MEAINNSFFEKTLLDFQKRKDNIKKMLDDINDVISDINISANIFEKQLNFNKTIINAYKESKINYYILDNFKNLDFVLNTKNYEKKWNINNFRLKEQNKEKFQLNTKKLPRFILPNLILNLNNKSGQDSKKTEFEGFTNMWISEKYCKSWGLREAIREFLQNQHDGIISKLKTKNDLQVIKIGKKENINNMKVYVNFDFINKANNKIYGHIRYDNIKNILTISNKGFLWLGDFILGCSKDEENNPDLIGTFGEGMKLAILALCRLNKNVTIISACKKYNFIIKEDPIFLKDNQPQKCLHFKYEIFNDINFNMVKVIINNINIEEWGSQIINFLWLLNDDAKIYTSKNNNNREVGQILYEEYLRGKIYVKGIFVQHISLLYSEDKADCPGFNIDIKLNRDRNSIPNKKILKEIVSSILSSFCNKNIKYILEMEKERERLKEKEMQKKRESDSKKRQKSAVKNNYLKNNDNKDKFKSLSKDKDRKESNNGINNQDIDYENILKEIIDILENDNIDLIDSYDFADSLSKEVIEYIWKKIYSVKDKNKSPVYYEERISNFLESKNLSKEFYPYFKVNFSMMKILEKSKNYISIEDKFSIYVENSITVEPKGIYKSSLKEIYSKIKIMKESFNEKQVVFKSFEKGDKDFCYIERDKINFSSLKLTEPINNSWKFWIFVKILQFLNIKIEENYRFINNVFENEEEFRLNNTGGII